MLGSLKVNSSNPWSGCGLGMRIRVSLGYCQQEDPDAVAGEHRHWTLGPHPAQTPLAVSPWGTSPGLCFLLLK